VRLDQTYRLQLVLLTLLLPLLSTPDGSLDSLCRLNPLKLPLKLSACLRNSPPRQPAPDSCLDTSGCVFLWRN